MKLHLSKSPVFAFVVIAGLAAATALVAGYVEKPNDATQVAADSKCSGCPLLDTPECCKVTGVCANPESCSGDCLVEAGRASCGNSAAAKLQSADCPHAKTQSAGCALEGAQVGGCARDAATTASAPMPGCGGCMNTPASAGNFAGAGEPVE